MTPSLLKENSRACPRRLRYELYRELSTSRSEFTLGRLRDPLMVSLQDAHSEMRSPAIEHFKTPADLLPEEQALFERMARNYVELFGAVPARAVTHPDLEGPRLLRRRKLEVGGWVDLVVETEEGHRELRQFVRGATICADPMQSTEMLCVAIRMMIDFAHDQPVTFRHVDLLTGDMDTSKVEFGNEGDVLVRRFDGLVTALRDKTASPVPKPGIECGWCKYVKGCEAHPEGAA